MVNYSTNLRWPKHLWAAALFVVFALVWTAPLALHLTNEVPGAGPGDNLAFLWNFWWMRQALARPDLSFFHSDWLFAPFGIDLTLHTHTALSAFIGGTVLSRLSIVAAQNVVIIATLAFNGFAAYLLAFDRTGSRHAALVGGLLFAGSPYLATHLLGHFNLIGAWGIPLYLMHLIRATERRSWRSSVAAGLCLVAIVYTDYYYFVYCIALAALFIGWHLRPIGVSIERKRPPAWGRRIIALLLAVDGAIIGVILVNLFIIRVGQMGVTPRQLTNPLTAAWLLAALWALAAVRLRFERRRVDRQQVADAGRAFVPMAIVAVAGVAPLLVMGAEVWARGDYIAPAHTWRSGPGGVDLATVLLGNPLHPLWGSAVTRAYDRLGINRIEGVGWLGVVSLIVLWRAVPANRHASEARRWLTIGAIFVVWALGPWLTIGGFNTGLMLPQNLFQFVPVLANARMPGRAMVVVYLAIGLLAAIVLSRLDRQAARRLIPAAVSLIVLDFLPAPFPLTRIDHPTLYDEISKWGSGAVIELPVGARDGFGQLGRFDDRTLVHQTVHRRPIVGGFAARIPPAISRGYQEMPVVRSLFRLSEGLPANPADEALTGQLAHDALKRAGIAVLVLNRDAAPPALLQFMDASLLLKLVGRQDGRELYVIE